MSNPLTTITDIRETAVATSSVSLGAVTLSMTSRHLWTETGRSRKQVRLTSTYALGLRIGHADLPMITWTAQPDDWETADQHMADILKIDVGVLIGVDDPEIAAQLREHVLAHFYATQARSKACDAARLPDCENAKSAAKRQLIADAKAAGYKADHSADATVLTKGTVSVTVYARGLTVNNHATHITMSLADARKRLDLDVQR